MKFFNSFIFTVFLAGSAFAQSLPPSTDIYVFDLKEKKGKITVSDGKNITDRSGYDNQPAFFNNDYVMYTASQTSGQTDIMLYDLYENKVTNLTETRDSEYSPYPIPEFNSFVVVRVEADNSQRLWMYPIDGNAPPQLLFDKIQPVGYFAINEKDVLMFVLGEPVTLVQANMSEVDDDIITSNIGRTIRSITGTKDFAFEKREDDDTFAIYRLNKVSKQFKKVIQKPEGAADWGLTPKGTYITSVGTKLLAFNPKYHNSWQEITDLGEMASQGITRMAVSQENDRLAVVINN